MEDSVKCWCQHCGTELLPSHTGPCPKYGDTRKKYEAKIVTSMGHHARLKSRLRQKDIVSGKIKREIAQGQVTSGDPKLKDGVNIIMVIDKEKSPCEYHQVV